jgi:formamidopyrimidine-DNA glycosylase
MPELPEVETVCRGLAKEVIGERIKSVKVLRHDSIGSPSWTDFQKNLTGHVFRKIRRRGKYILIDLDKDAGLVCHLRMSGRLLLAEQGKIEGPFLRVRIVLASGRELHFEDMRVFGRLWYVPTGKKFEEIVPTLGKLGLEPIAELTATDLKKLLKKRKQTIKSLLLDQSVISGVGNIYADESLFQAGIHPGRAAGSLKSLEVEKLTATIKAVLEQAINLGGSTLRDYTSAEGVNGRYQHQAWVYGRTGENCRACNNLIERIKIAGRSSHFCPLCQGKGVRKK